MIRIRLTGAGWENFTGNDFAGVAFENGVSVETVERPIANRIAALVPCEIIEESGKSGGQAGLQREMQGQGNIAAPVLVPMAKQTMAERNAEITEILTQNQKNPADKIYTRGQLQEISDAQGIVGLRKIGALWNVKDRTIKNLIDEILTAQAKWLAGHEKRAAAERDARQKAIDEALANQQAIEKSITDQARVLTGPSQEELDQDLVDEIMAIMVSEVSSPGTADTTPNAIGPNGEPVHSSENPNKGKK